MDSEAQGAQIGYSDTAVLFVKCSFLSSIPMTRVDTEGHLEIPRIVSGQEYKRRGLVIGILRQVVLKH